MKRLGPGSIAQVYDPMACEKAVLSSLPEWVPGSPPVRIVVPSESLRRHWVRRIAQTSPAKLGLEVLTHNQAVRTILHRAGVAPCAGRMWPEHLAQEAAAEEPILAHTLGSLENGFNLVASAVSELSDAGVALEHFDGLIDSIRGWPSQPSVAVSGGVAPRVIAVMRVARCVGVELQGTRYVWPGQAIGMAIDLLRADAQTVFPSSAIFALGYADATGTVADFLEALHGSLGATLLIDSPRSPTDPSMTEPGVAFAEPFLRRFEGRWSEPIGKPARPKPVIVSAPEPYEEVRVAADSIRTIVGEGCAPEDIAIVVRNLAPWAEPLRACLHDYGIPFSGVGGCGSGDASARRTLAIADVFRQGTRAEISRWIGAAGLAEQHDLALALDVYGVRWVNEINDRVPQVSGSLPLPVREGFNMVDGVPVNLRVKVPQSAVEHLQSRSADWCAAWAQWPDIGSGATHVLQVEGLLKGALSVPSSDSAWVALRTVGRSIPDDVNMPKSAFVQLYANALDPHGTAPIGGHGGGVAVLDAIEARGRTFEHLFVLGMNRGQFPRVVREDPLLPEPARRALGQLVPDIRERRLGNDEERFLFAQLLYAAPNVHLSMSERDTTGKVLHPSSLIVGLLLHEQRPPVETVRPTVRPRWSANVATALHAEVPSTQALGLPTALANLSALRNGKNGVHNPYMGSIGRAVHELDSRNRPVYVTAIEAVARCPWQAFLVRDLGLEARPDPWGPLPAVDTYLLGRVIHAVAERLVLASRSGADAGVSVPMQWPSDSTLETWTLEAARVCLMEDGVAWQGFARAVVAPTRAAINLLKEIDADLEGVMGGEVDGQWPSPNGCTIHFRADRVGRASEQEILTDFKLGSPPTVHKKADTRRVKVVESIRSGKLLQGMVYACSQPGAVGQYLYLNPEKEYPQRRFDFDATDLEALDALESIVEEVTDVRKEGAMFPRVSESKTDKIPATCEYCVVREACSVLDSGRRRRVMEYAIGRGETPLSNARAALWWRGGEDAP